MAPEKGKQRLAVVIIHGIGEQRPMQTLQGFVSTFLGSEIRREPNTPAEPRFYSKPDRLTDTLELRRLSAWPPNVPTQTDFYELYWAHLMLGTVWSHVVAWLRMLMLRLPWRAAPVLQLLWLLSWAAVFGAVYCVCNHPQWIDLPKLLALGIGGGAAYVFIRCLGFFGLRYVGDAARYLSPFPENIEARKNIRNAVIGLLAKVHEERPVRYDRIIVVGHSLGSVIAYDALTHLWQASHSRLPDPGASDQQQLRGSNRLRKPSRSQAAIKQPHLEQSRRLAIHLTHNPPTEDRTRVDPRVERYRRRQRRLWSEQLSVGIDWRITDLVTLGSPLAHCSFLLAGNQRQWERMKQQREYPTSPPQLEDERDKGKLVKRNFSFPAGKGSNVQILHHAALFACTRWTNLYFRADLVGGRVGGPDHFGVGVKDVEVKPARWWSRTPLSHICYWKCSETFARRQLRLALKLSEGAGLVSISDETEANPDPVPS